MQGNESAKRLIEVQASIKRLRAHILASPDVAEIEALNKEQVRLLSDATVRACIKEAIEDALRPEATVAFQDAGFDGEVCCIEADVTVGGKHESAEFRRGPALRRVVRLLEAALPGELLGLVRFRMRTNDILLTEVARIDYWAGRDGERADYPLSL